MKSLKKRAESLPLELCQLKADCQRLQTDLLTDIQQVKDLLLGNPALLAAALKALRHQQLPAAASAARSVGQQRAKAPPIQAKPTGSGSSSSSNSSYKTASTGGGSPARRPTADQKSVAARLSSTSTTKTSPPQGSNTTTPAKNNPPQGSNPTTSAKNRPPVPSKPTRDRLNSNSSQNSASSRQNSTQEGPQRGGGDDCTEMSHLVSAITKLKEGVEQLPPPEDSTFTHIPPTPTIQQEFFSEVKSPIAESFPDGKSISGNSTTDEGISCTGSPNRDGAVDQGDSDASSMCSSNDLRITEGIPGRQTSTNQALNDLRDNIAVLCRLRPTSKAADGNETKKASIEVDRERGGSISVSNKGRQKTFDVNRVMDSSSSQQQVFDEMKPLISSCLEGSSLTLFSYGHTGAGKTHTLLGTDEDPGLVQRSVEYFIENRTSVSEPQGDHSTYTVNITVVEIYNDMFRDVLKDKRLEAKQNADSSIGLPGLSCVEIDSTEKLLETLKQASTNRIKGMGSYGSSSGKITAAAAAEHCSRSHLLITLSVHRTAATAAAAAADTEEASRTAALICKLNLVDLAGSERVDKTGVEPSRYKEAQNINKTLTCVGDVMYALKVKAGHVPIRSSKLTHLLQDSLVGPNSKILLLVLLSSAARHVTETIASLMFANRLQTAEVVAMPRTPSRAQGEISAEALSRHNRVLMGGAENSDSCQSSGRRMSIGSEQEQAVRVGGARRPSAPSMGGELSLVGGGGGGRRERRPSDAGSVEDGLDGPPTHTRPAKPSANQQVGGSRGAPRNSPNRAGYRNK